MSSAALDSQSHNMPARVARCAGAAGGSQPPHEDPSKLPLQCESAQPGAGRKRKGRGPARGIEILRRLVHGRIHVDFDEEGGTWKALGDDGPLYDSAVGILTRYYCKPIYDSWAEVPIEQRVQVLERLLDWFDIDYHYQQGVYSDMVQRDAMKCYRDWKSDLHDHFKKVGGVADPGAAKQKVPKNIRDRLHWELCCERFSSEKFKRKSKTNSKNRAEHSWESKHGRISYAQHRSKKVDPETLEPISRIDNWRDMHRDGRAWVNRRAQETYHHLQERAEQAAASSSGRVNERAIMEETFGRRRGHMTGVGPSLSRRAPTAAPQEPVLLPWGLDLQNARRDQLVSLVEHLIGLLRQWAPNVQIPQVFPRPSGGPPSSSNSRNPNRFNDGAEDFDLND
ncbi:Unknown protein [Striga hermonthica]|uniref:Transposase n=1 Tax=Striga hermonthica TaxID=68872 RepID=A0A9N7RPH1_STRHE|nr:Unknown protein [Striga hermonthica]